ERDAGLIDQFGERPREALAALEHVVQRSDRAQDLLFLQQLHAGAAARADRFPLEAAPHGALAALLRNEDERPVGAQNDHQNTEKTGNDDQGGFREHKPRARRPLSRARTSCPAASCRTREYDRRTWAGCRSLETRL